MFFFECMWRAGKTYTVNLVLKEVRARSYIVSAIAASGITSTLINNGRTLRCRAKIHLNISETSTYNIGRRDATAELFTRARFFIIDEITMLLIDVIEALDRSLTLPRLSDFEACGSKLPYATKQPYTYIIPW